MLSHDNLLHDTEGIFEAVAFVEAKEIIISYLPLSHVAAQVIQKKKHSIKIHHYEMFILIDK